MKIRCAALIICANLCAKTLSKTKEAPAFMDSQVPRKTWTAWLDHFAERVRGKLAMFYHPYFLST